MIVIVIYEENISIKGMKSGTLKEKKLLFFIPSFRFYYFKHHLLNPKLNQIDRFCYNHLKNNVITKPFLVFHKFLNTIHTPIIGVEPKLHNLHLYRMH